MRINAEITETKQVKKQLNGRKIRNAEKILLFKSFLSLFLWKILFLSYTQVANFENLESFWVTTGALKLW